ncbi:uncharacterized protein LOC128737255 [Sabethes cyaneus]|uniref:uncharacterized protein LOC128737255 n=1 Tax=Sabethes cyaneus TaxID=53552 RepID=UPI00237E626D|nr:uncharacterized protein LOC128737255 [Sabethes cyaneus]
MSKTIKEVFCRLCLVETRNRVVIFPRECTVENRVQKLLKLVEIELSSKTEPDAVLCFECLATLEEFYKFKKQCHENDEHMKSLNRTSNKPLLVAQATDTGIKHTNKPKMHEKKERISDASDISPKNFNKQYQAFIGSQKFDTNVTFEEEHADITLKEEAFFKASSKTFGLAELNKMLVLSEPYGNFHFEKTPRSNYYNLVYNGERYNSALFTARFTYWQCIYRKKHFCKAQICCTNDYKHFEKRHTHSHGALPEKSGIIYQPTQALPEIFEICRAQFKKKLGGQRQIVEGKKRKHIETINTTESSSNAHSEYVEEEVIIDDELPNSTEFIDISGGDGEYIIETLDESEEDLPADNSGDYAATSEELHDDDDANDNVVSKSTPDSYSKKSNPPKQNRKSVTKPSHAAENDGNKETQFYLTIDPQVMGKTDFSNPVLAESYPDYFHFEKNPRSVNYTLVFFGERFNSARYGVNYTYWQCAHRTRYRCSAVLRTTNDYTAFERTQHHTHGEVTVKKKIVFTPREALPDIFKITRSRSAWKNAVANQQNSDQSDESSDEDRSDQSNYGEDSSCIEDDKAYIRKHKKQAKGKQKTIPKECVVESLPVLDNMLVLADSYPDSFYFEKSPRSTYFTLIYDGERYNSPLFTTRHTYWQCAHRRRFQCQAQITVTNDYLKLEKRHEHNHDQLVVQSQTEYTPQEALPLIFEACRKIAYKKRSRDRVKRLYAKEAYEEATKKENKDASCETAQDSSNNDEIFLEFVEDEVVKKKKKK